MEVWLTLLFVTKICYYITVVWSWFFPPIWMNEWFGISCLGFLFWDLVPVLPHWWIQWSFSLEFSFICCGSSLLKTNVAKGRYIFSPKRKVDIFLELSKSTKYFENYCIFQKIYMKNVPAFYRLVHTISIQTEHRSWKTRKKFHTEGTVCTVRAGSSHSYNSVITRAPVQVCCFSILVRKPKAPGQKKKQPAFKLPKYINFKFCLCSRSLLKTDGMEDFFVKLKRVFTNPRWMHRCACCVLSLYVANKMLYFFNKVVWPQTTYYYMFVWCLHLS
jgi:hypothetical protein